MSATLQQFESPRAAARRLGWRAAILLGGLALVLAVVMAQLFWPRLTPEEQHLVGHWYGYYHDPAAEKHYAWLVDERRDRSFTITFRNFWKQTETTQVSPYLSSVGSQFVLGVRPGGSDEWLVSDETESGRWSCANGTFSSRMLAVDEEPAPLGKLIYFLANFEWPASFASEHEYVVKKVLPDEFWYDFPAESMSFRALRVPPDFALPDVPTTVDAVRAQLGLDVASRE